MNKEEDVEIFDDNEIFGLPKETIKLENTETDKLEKEIKNLSTEENIGLKKLIDIKKHEIEEAATDKETEAKTGFDVDKLIDYRKKEIILEQKKFKDKIYQYLLSLLMWIAFILIAAIVIYLFVSYKSVVLEFIDKIL